MVEGRAPAWAVLAACCVIISACESEPRPAVLADLDAGPGAESDGEVRSALGEDARVVWESDVGASAERARDASLPGRAEGGAAARGDDASAAPALPTSIDAGLDGSTGPQTARADAAASAGSGSCFGRCGAETLLAIAGDCACDVGCQQRGDCCGDKHELCAASEASALCALTGREGAPAACGSDLGWSFVHEGAIEIFFGDSYDVNCGVPLAYDDAQGRLPLVRPKALPERPRIAPAACGDVLQLDTSGGARSSFAPMRLFEQGRALSSWLLETPLTGFSDGARVYTLSRRGSEISAPLYLAVRDPDAAPHVTPGRTVYRVLTQWQNRHFKNVTATGVARDVPERPSESDYREGTHTLFLLGRDTFYGADGEKLYLARQTLPLEDDEWSPQFFAGMEGERPRWSASEESAVPVIEEDFSLLMQHEVAFVPELGRWVMLYGGDASDGLDGAPNDQPRHGAIHMRMAPHPWGPWSAATPVLFREHAAAFLHCDAPRDPPGDAASGCDLDDLPNDPARSYSTGAWGPSLRDFEGCRTDAPLPRQPALTPGSPLPCLGSQRGNLYAPNLLLPWTVDRAGEQGYARAATLYFNVSTWYPYQVVLAAISVHVP